MAALIGLVVGVLLIGSAITITLSFLAYFDGRESSVGGRRYRNEYVMPFAILYDRGYESGKINGSLEDKNKKRFKRE